MARDDEWELLEGVPAVGPREHEVEYDDEYAAMAAPVDARPVVALCTKCGRPILGGADDPLARIEGEPYHRTPCYRSERQRIRRSERRRSG